MFSLRSWLLRQKYFVVAEHYAACQINRSGMAQGAVKGVWVILLMRRQPPKESLSALLPLQGGGEKPQSVPNSGLTSQKSCPPYR